MKTSIGNEIIYTNMKFDKKLKVKQLEAKYKVTREGTLLLKNLYPVFKVTSFIFNILENRFLHKSILNKKIEKPIFILGNFRTGTTFLERVLSRHSTIGYFTYVSQLYPLSPILGNQFMSLFPNIHDVMTPPHQPNMHITIHWPYEGEAIWRYCKNNCWTQKNNNILSSNFKDLSFEKIYKQSINKHLHYQKRIRYINKNPWNTLRIGYLSRLFPDAKFVYIRREPRRVLRSQLDLEEQIERVFHNIKSFNNIFSDQFMPPRIFFRTSAYSQIMSAYSKDKALGTALSIVDFEKEFNRQVKEAKLENKICRVQYEEILENFTSELKKILNYIEVTDNEADQIISSQAESFLNKSLASNTSPLPEFPQKTLAILDKLHPVNTNL